MSSDPKGGAKSGWWGLSKPSDSTPNSPSPERTNFREDTPSGTPSRTTSRNPDAVALARQGTEQKKKEPSSMTHSDNDAFLPSGMEIEGTVKTDRPLTINGKISGKVQSTSHVLIGDSGEVEADIQCAKLEVYGNVNGEVTATEHTALFKGGRLIGKINTPSLQTEAGAFFKGVVEMIEPGLPAKSPSTATMPRPEQSMPLVNPSKLNP